jgi:putative oxidoreductase
MSDSAAWILLVGRVLFSVNFVAVAGLSHITKGQMMAGFARQTNFPAPALASWPSGLWLMAGGLSIALGIWADVGALMIAVFVVIAGEWFHRFWEIEDAQQKQMQSLLFWRNVTFLGAAIILFAFFASFGHDLPLTITDPLFDLR